MVNLEYIKILLADEETINMESKLVPAVKSKKSANRYIASTAVLVLVTLIFYLLTYVFKTVPENRIFTYTIIIAIGAVSFFCYGALLIRNAKSPKDLIVLCEGELVVNGKRSVRMDEIKDVQVKHNLSKNARFSYGRIVIITKDNKRINVYDVENVSDVQTRVLELLGKL